MLTNARAIGLVATGRCSDVRVDEIQQQGWAVCCTQNKIGDVFEQPRSSVPFVPLGGGAVADLRANRSAAVLHLPDVASHLRALGTRQQWLCL
jgi:hypothetical protein